MVQTLVTLIIHGTSSLFSHQVFISLSSSLIASKSCGVRCVGDGGRSRMDWEPLVGNPHVGGLIVLVAEALTWGQQHSAGISQVTGQPYLGTALPTPIRGRVDKRRPKQMPAPVSTAVGNRACWGIPSKRSKYKKSKETEIRMLERAYTTGQHNIGKTYKTNCSPSHGVSKIRH